MTMAAMQYRNEYVKEWTETASHTRYDLRPRERHAYDAVAHEESPDPLEAGDWVEVKACKRWVENGDDYGTAGRWFITDSSHRKLKEANGYYCLIVYDLVEQAGDRVLIHAMRLISASDLDAYLMESPRLPYPEVFPEVHPGSSPESEPETAREDSRSGESDSDPMPVIAEREFTTAESNEERYPDDLRDRDIWLVWCYDSAGRKVPRAPWMTETCYPVSWGADAVNRPETTFEEAHRWSGMRGTDIEQQWPFPDSAGDKNLKLGMMLPHEPDANQDHLPEPPDPPIMQIDLDNVRHPETAEVTPEAEAILDMFPEAYAQVSTSGTGVHVYVRASLPERMGKFIETIEFLPRRPAFSDIDEPQQIELYDHGRFVAITGEHIEGHGTALPESQERVDSLIEEYETRSSGGSGGSEPIEFDPSMFAGDRSSGAGNSPYYSEGIARFGQPAANAASTGEGFGGAHPAHGGTGKKDHESTNYAVNTRENLWHCFAHNSGGGPLSLVAVMENELDCESPRLGRLSDEAFTRVCLAARDAYGFSGDPPYRALVGVARRHRLAMANTEEGILGRDCYAIARQMYDNMDVSDME